jgi:hypothetical protein
MSKLSTSNDKKAKNKPNIFHTNAEDNSESNPNRKRSERQASQGVKVLVNRERGINQEAVPAIHVEQSNAIIQEVKKVVTPSNFNPSISQGNMSNTIHSLPTYNPLMSSLYPLNTNLNPSQTSQVTITSNVQKNIHHSGNLNYINPHTSYRQKDDKILSRSNFEKILNEICNFMNTGIEIYMKNVIEKLICISRMRNVNLNLYSKQSEKNPIFKIHTFNVEKTSQEVSYAPYKDFSILFTKNMKNTMGMLEQYEELNLKKLRQEKVSLYKSKLEEITQQKEKDKESALDINKTKESALQGKLKPRVRKRDTILKSVRNTLAKSQKRDEMAKHKKETQNTLDTFLDGRTRSTNIGNVNLSQSQQSHQRYDTEMVSNIGESHNLETFTKFSELSKSEVPGEVVSNDINLTVFKYHLPSQNPKLNIPVSVRRRITLKDLIHFLEGERKTPLQNLILHKALVRLNQSSLNM